MEDERSLNNQIRYIEDYIRKFPNMKLTDRYVDNGFSGTNFDRPQFIRLMEDVKSGLIDCIVVKDLSRFGRNFIEAGYYIEKIFPYLNVRLIAINDNFDSFDPAKKDALTVPIKNLVNEIYTKDIARKAAATYRAKEKRGQIIYGLPPYGYLKDEENPFRMRIDRDAEPIVRQMFSWAAHGMTSSEIMRRLNDAGVPTPKEAWLEKGVVKTVRSHTAKRDADIRAKQHQTTVRRILENPTYMGDMVYGGESGTRKEKKDWHKNNRTNTPRTVWRVIPDAHDALVSREDFEKIQEELSRRGEGYKKSLSKREEQRKRLPDILNGKFYCAECGRTMLYRRYLKDSGSRIRDYICSGFYTDKTGWDMEAESTPKCRKEKTEINDRLCRTLIFDQIRLQIEAGVQLEELAGKLAGVDESRRAELAEAVRVKEIEAENITAKLHKLYEDYRDKVIDSDDYLTIREDYLAKQEMRRSELETLKEQLAAAEGRCLDKEWNELKERLAGIGDGECTDDCVEIIEDEEPPIPGTERLTKELLDEMVERVEYGSDRILHITFRHKDWVAELAEKLEQSNQGETDVQE